MALLLFINVLSAVGLIAYQRLRGPSLIDRRIEKLPNYRDVPNADTIFSEMDLLNNVQYEPFVGWKTRPLDTETITVNNEGDRVQPESSNSARTGPVVRFFGGSTVVGYGVDNGGTIPAFFQKLMPTAEVHNHGAVGLNVRQNLDRLVNLLNEGARIDVAVFYLGINEVGSLCRRDTSLNGHGQEASVRNLLENGQSTRFLVARLLHRVFITKTQAALTRIARGENPPEGGDPYLCTKDPDRARAVVDHVAHILRTANELVTAAGGRFVALLQPAALLPGARVDHVKNEIDKKKELGEELALVYPLLRERMRLAGTTWWHDVSDAFDGDEYIYLDYAHVSANGNEIISRKVESFLRAGNAPG